MTYYETEQTILIYYIDYKGKENKLIIPLTDFSLLFNKNNSTVYLYLNKKLEGLGKGLQRLNIDVTNDPKTDQKFNITNLGYYSIRIIGQDCEVFHFNNKTLFKFDFSKFNIHFNLPIWLPHINNQNIIEQFKLSDTDITLFYKFVFCDSNYNIDTFIHRNDILTIFNMNLLKIEDNYKFISTEHINLNDTLKQFKLI